MSLEFKLFEERLLGRFFYTFIAGKTVIVDPQLVKYEEVLEYYYIEYPIQCKVTEIENFIILTPGKSSIMYILELPYIHRVEGKCKFYYYNDGEYPEEKYEPAIVITKPLDKVKVYWGETRFESWEDWIAILKNGKVEMERLNPV